MSALSCESAISPPSAERGDRGEDENDCREEDLEAGALSAEPEENEHDQHVADEIVVERREELTPEQRREAPRRHQGPKHDGRRPMERERMGRLNLERRQAAATRR